MSKVGSWSPVSQILIPTLAMPMRSHKTLYYDCAKLRH